MRNILSGDGNFSATQVSSSYLAAVGLFTLQNLRSLLIDYKRDDADFYKGICEAASQSKIEELKHVQNRFFPEVRLGPEASSHYARAICSMPNLRSLELNNVGLSDEYYSTMAAEASTSKIEKLKRVSNKVVHLGPAASSHYARAICSMPNLRSLELINVDLSDEYYSTMAAEASRSKIQTLSIERTVVTRHSLHAILSLPCLQSLSLTYLYDVLEDKDDESIPIPRSSLVELTVDIFVVAMLWKLGLHTSCSLVKKLSLHYDQDDFCGIGDIRIEDRIVDGHMVSMVCSPFTHLIELHIIAGDRERLDPVSFCNAVMASCPGLVELLIYGLYLGNIQSNKIIQSMKAHPHLTRLLMKMCYTDKDLDPLIAQMNSEGKLIVAVEHGWKCQDDLISPLSFKDSEYFSLE